MSKLSFSRRPASTFSWFKFGLLLVLLLAACSLFTPYPAQLVAAFRGSSVGPELPLARELPPLPQDLGLDAPVAEPVPAPTPQPAPADKAAQPIRSIAWQPADSFALPSVQLPAFPPALPERVEPGNYEHMGSISRGVNLKSQVKFVPGSTASLDRKKKEAYAVKLSLELLLPQAAKGKELLHANPKLPQVLPAYDVLMAQAEISPWYHSLYLHKQNRVRQNAATLSRLLDRHNFFDTDTILNIKAPQTGRKLLWFQADMDVVSDGSDGDRLPDMPKAIKESDFYQPTTSYRWAKRTSTPNPLLVHWETRLKRLQKEKGSASAIDYARRTISELKTFSFLLADYDPFIVIPLTFKEGKSEYMPAPGDYAVVIVGHKVYPCIVGDYGPRFKAGEASLRLCKAINPRASSVSRPISDLSVSYLVFPGTKEENAGPIDYARLNARCRELLQDIGGMCPSAQFVEMDDQLKQPEPEPAVEPNKPAPSESPSQA